MIFDDIYARNIWRGTESRSGPGSGSDATRLVGVAIADLVERKGFRSVLDVGCGDGFWMPDLPGYLGIDVSAEAVRLSRERHPDRAYVVGSLADIAPMLRVDLVIMRDVIQHLPLEDGLRLIAAAKGAGHWILASTYTDGDNVGCDPRRALTGWAYTNDLTARPFSLGPPVESIPDGYAYQGEGIRDARKSLGLWRS